MDKLQKKYKETVVSKMMEKFGYKNPMAVPKIVKVTLNTSFGKQAASKAGAEREKTSKAILQDITLIAGQKAVLTRAKKSIAGFKVRQGIEIGVKVTLRRQKMWDFLERLIYLSLPKSRDFKGIDPKSIDGYGNLDIGFKEHLNFPEVSAEREKTIFGLQVTVSTNAKDREKGLELFKLLGFPIKT